MCQLGSNATHALTCGGGGRGQIVFPYGDEGHEENESKEWEDRELGQGHVI